MSHHVDNVRPLICPQLRRYRNYTRVADVIPLYPAHRHHARWLAVAFCVLALAAMIATAAATALGVRGV